MGIYDRDYYRGNSEGFLGGWNRWSACTWIIVFTVATFIVQLLTRDLKLRDLTSFGIYDYRAVLAGEIWRLVTPIFLHDTNNLLHIVFNMLILYWFGRRLEEVYGSREFLAFYLVAGVFANTANFLTEWAGLADHSRALGASGAVTAVLVLYAVNYPRQQVLLFFIIPMPIWALVILFIVLDGLGVIGARRDNIAYLIHLYGALFGFVYARAGWRLTDFSLKIPAPKRERTRPRLRVIPQEEIEKPRPKIAPELEEALDTPAEESEPLDSQLDRVLEKVSRYGQESLTPVEREILFRASDVYKKRRR